MIEDAERWDGRYAGKQSGPARAPKGLDGIALPPAGLCVDVACGLGEQSLWAAELGYEVVALDVSSSAIGALRVAAGERGLVGRIDARVVDLDDGLPVDVIGRASIVICQRFRDVGLYPQLAAAVAPGGLIVVTVLSQVGLDGQAGEFHAGPGELIDHFRRLDVDVLRSIEADGEATLVARRRHSA